MSDVKLLPLPQARVQGVYIDGYSIDQMHDYARACIEADREARPEGGEARAWLHSAYEGEEWLTWSREDEQAERSVPLYTRPAPPDVARLVEADNALHDALNDSWDTFPKAVWDTAIAAAKALAPFTATQQEADHD